MILKTAGEIKEMFISKKTQNLFIEVQWEKVQFEIQYLKWKYYIKLITTKSEWIIVNFKTKKESYNYIIKLLRWLWFKDKKTEIKEIWNTLENFEFTIEETKDLKYIRMFKQLFYNEDYKDWYYRTDITSEIKKIIKKIEKDKELKDLLHEVFWITSSWLSINVQDSYTDNTEERLELINKAIWNVNNYFYRKLDRDIYNKEKIQDIKIKNLCKDCWNEECECEICEQCGSKNSFSHSHYDKIATCKKCWEQHSY